MSSAGFILAINFLVGGVFALIFGLIAAYDKAYRSARWFAFAYGMGMVNMSFEFALHYFPEYSRFLVVGIFTTFLISLLSGIVGLYRRFNVEPPYYLLVGVFAISVVINNYIYDLPRSDLLRQLLYQGPYMVAQGLAAFAVFRYGRQRLEMALGVMLTLSGLNYLAKPFVSAMVGGPGLRPQDYVDTAYALYSQTIGAFLAVSLGVMFVMVYVYDMLADIRAESETDRLSGLLNRRGFEARVEQLRQSAVMPATLVMCDLDHFKQINDEFGHVVGDHVIEVFSTQLRLLAPETAVVGRMGGEEFAVLLPMVNVIAGRLFAENVRASFANMPIRDLPRLRRVTASFGVAEMEHGEPYASMLQRADKALYDAKADGRNRVSVAAPLPAFDRRRTGQSDRRARA
ncbi:GGDEF domain-containing protein [Mariluticola halotolerans]|uniref:GGDEF domain-containing protein n=1 Tax=Mariluticola halotolerans TaxID=2909283 RepID=UPI0026E47F6E|nr:GGDEF domain-containing protein [Mariluticola halotolerans]UJQ93647.1 GGDEF domain-containing protein [Mariluticola halotolerans]